MKKLILILTIGITGLIQGCVTGGKSEGDDFVSMFDDIDHLCSKPLNNDDIDSSVWGAKNK